MASISIFKQESKDCDLNVDLRYFLPRSNNASALHLHSVACSPWSVEPRAHHTASHTAYNELRMYVQWLQCVIYNAAHCVIVAGTSGQLPCVALSLRISVVKHAACIPGYLEAVLV